MYDTPPVIISGDKEKDDEEEEDVDVSGVKKVLSKKEKEKLKKERDKVYFTNHPVRKQAKLHRFHRQRKRHKLPQRRPLKMISSYHNHHNRLFQNPRQPHLQ